MIKTKNYQNVKIFDTTLRDGSQSSDVRFSIKDKLEIVKALDDFGVDYIELGYPGSNEKDMQAFLETSKFKLKNSKIVAFGSTRRRNIKAKDDVNLKAIIKSKASIACIFGKAWVEHVEKQLNMNKEENLEAIQDSITFLKNNNLRIFYDAEHFFDGFKDNKEFSLACLEKAAHAGAECLILCDTNGSTLPEEFDKILTEVKDFLKKKKIKTELGVHIHNDSGFALANTTRAIDHGITHLQVTVNGFGERAGNADLCQVLPVLMLKKGTKLPKIKLKDITKLSKLVYTLANIKPNNHQPFVGKNAFSHKGGMHVDALMKGATYEHISPGLVGNVQNIILSDLSGKANIIEVVKKFGYKATKDDFRVSNMLKKVELLERKGYDISELNAEKYLLTEEFFGNKGKLFEIKTWKILSEQRNGEFSECILTGKVNNEFHDVVAPVKGGPVDAVFHALKKLIRTKYDNIESVKLINYKVMIAQDKGAESSVRVYIEFKNGKEEFGTVGVSTNILEASLEAIEKGFRYFLLKHC